MTAQLPLDLRLEHPTRLENFIPGANTEALAAVHRCLDGDEPYVYLWGSTGSGRSHLLQAAALATGGRYLPASGLGEPPDGDLPDLLCLDDLHHLAGDRLLEARLFTWFNRLREAGRRLLVAADRPAAHLPVALPDLASRLAWGPGYRLRPLDDEALGHWLRQNARERGMQLSEAAVRYILYRCPRDPTSLGALMERLDRETLAAQRSATIPVICQVIRAASAPTPVKQIAQTAE